MKTSAFICDFSENFVPVLTKADGCSILLELKQIPTPVCFFECIAICQKSRHQFLEEKKNSNYIKKNLHKY
jgi:hypothetical protein